MQSNPAALISTLILFFVLAATAYGVGSRPFYVGADTSAYLHYYNEYQGLFVGRVESGFSILTFILRTLNVRDRIYLSILYIVLCIFFTIFLLLSFRPDRAQRASVHFIVMAFAALLFSRWFENAAVNGIRQGLAAPLVYITLLLIGRRRFIVATMCGIAAVCFHVSAALVLLVSPLVLLKERMHLYIFTGACIAYAGGLNVSIIRALPTLFGVNLYTYIIDYSIDDSLWSGVQAIFVLYTCFFMAMFYAASRLLLHSIVFKEYIRIYSTLSCMYFLFGFGAFSNRFAIYAWLFTSIPLARIAYELITDDFLTQLCGRVGIVVAGTYFFIRVAGIGG